MARVLYWNILSFSGSLIDTATNKRDRQDYEAHAGAGGPARLALIMNTLQAVDPATGVAALLDFIVIVEVSPGGSAEGQVVTGNGLLGCTRLYAALQAAYPGVWKMVPPIVTGTGGNAEAILIFYRSANWYFVGPEVAGVPYVANVLACMAARALPLGPYVPAARNETTSAGQWQFLNGPPPPAMGAVQVLFPGAPQRKPWLAAFRAVAGALPRTLVHLMGIHTKPNDTRAAVPVLYADQATANLATVYDMTAKPPLQANQIDVIVGDFNVDNIVAANFLAGGPFANLIGVGGAPVAPAYTALVQPGVMALGQESYFHTLGKPAHDAEGNAIIVEDDDGAYLLVGEYPGYEYSSLSLDNALVRYHPGTAIPANHHMTILARAQTQPYNAPVPPGPMLGYYQSNFRMADSIVDIANLYNGNLALADTEDPNAMFRDWDHYGRIRGVSDHFALLFDI